MKAAKTRVMHYTHKVEEIADFGKWHALATEYMQFKNDQIVAKTGDLEHQFYFLNYRVKGATHILVNDSATSLQPDDLKYLQILGAWIEQGRELGESDRTNKRNRKP